MSEENVEVVRRIYGEWGRGNFREGTELYDPHVLLVVRPEFGLASGVYCGPSEVARYMREVFLAEWEGLVIAGDEFVDAGDSVLVRVHQRGDGSAERRSRPAAVLPPLDLSRALRMGRNRPRRESQAGNALYV